MATMTAAVQPEAILKQLAQLWRDLGKNEDGQHTPVLRACSMTLIVVSEEPEELSHVGETIAALMHEHPSRAIVLRYQGDAQGVLEARVLAQCWMPVGRRQQICCEEIEITVSPDHLSDIPTALLGLTVPDLPVVVWFRQARLAALDGFAPLTGLASRLIIDSDTVPAAEPSVRQLAEARAAGRPLADLAYTRLTCWRESIAQMFDEVPLRERLPRLTRVRIVYAGDRVPAAAYYLGGWLRSILGPKLPLVLEHASAETDGLVGVYLENPLGDLHISHQEGSAVEVCTGVGQMRAVFPPGSDVELLSEELAILGDDPIFERTLACTLRLMEEQGR